MKVNISKGMQRSAILLSLALLAFSPAERGSELVNYYSFKGLRDSDMPRQIGRAHV